MVDSSSRSLLAPHGEPIKRPVSSTGKRNAYKTPLIIFPLSAILIGCIFASVAVLIVSNDDPVKSWKVQPSVLLSLLASIYAIVLGALFMAGVAITWWRSMTHGTTLKRLHFIYAGTEPKDFIRAIIAGSHARRVAIAALIIFLARIATGPLLQRSTKPETRTVTRNINVNMNIAGEIPNGFYGNWDRADPIEAQLAQQTIFNKTIKPIGSPNTPCLADGSCSALVPGAGLNYACTSDNQTIKMDDKNNVNTTIFRINHNITTEFGQPMLHLTVKYISEVDNSCMGTLTTESCYIIPATIWYPITISNGTLSMDAFSLLKNLTIVKNYTSAADATPANDSDPLGPLAGLREGIASLFQSEAVLNQNSDGQVIFLPSEKPYNSPSWLTLYLDSRAMTQKCSIVWINPTKIILAYFFDYMFRSAYLVPKNDQEYLQKITATFAGSELWYITDFRWLAAAVAVMALGTVAAMTLLWGWWQLDHYVTLSPLETGKAFGAPILQGAGPEQEANSIVREIGHERVAHDGDELVWNGTVYASGISSARGNSVQETGGLHSVQSSMSTRGHRRGMSSISEGGFDGNVPVPPTFEHSLGVSTRRWQDDGDEYGDISYAGRGRSNSANRDTAPLIITPGSPGVPELPPIPPTESLRMEPLSPKGKYRRIGEVGPEFGAGMASQRKSPSPVQTQNLRRKVSLIDEISRRTPV